jgi:HSP20 family protein
VDIVEMADELVLHADVPGVQLESLDVRFENGELLLHGKCPTRNENVNFLMNEFGVGDFYRTFAISETIDPSRISAVLKDGVLTLHLPKTERTKAKRIAVKAD